MKHALRYMVVKFFKKNENHGRVFLYLVVLYLKIAMKN